MFKNKAMVVLASAMFATPLMIQAQGVTPTAAGKGNTVSADQLIVRYTALAGSPANAKSLVNGLRTGSDISLIGPAVPEMQTITVTDYGACPSVVVKDFGPCPPVTVNTYGPCPPKLGPNGIPLPPDPTCRVVTGTTTQPAPAGCKVDLGTTHLEPPAPGCKVVTGTHQEQKPTGKMIDPAPVTFSPGAASPMGFGNVDIALALTEAKLGANATPSPDALKGALLEILGKRAAGEGWGKIAKFYGFQLQE